MLCVHVSGAARRDGALAPEPQSVTPAPKVANHFTFEIAVDGNAKPHYESGVRALLLVRGTVHYGSREVGDSVAFADVTARPRQARMSRRADVPRSRIGQRQCGCLRVRQVKGSGL